MALFRWRGDGAGNKFDFDDGRNWHDETGTPYAAARYPGSIALTYDDVIFDEALGAAADDPAGYDAVTAGDTMLRSFIVAPAYGKGTSAVNGDIGTNIGAPIDIEIAHDTDPKTEDSEVIIEGDNCGDIFLCGGGVDGLLRVTVRNLKSSSTLYLDEKIGILRILKGPTTLDAAAIVATEFTIGYVTSQPTDAVVIIPAGTTLPATINCYGGRTTCSIGLTTLNMQGGKWTQNAGNAANIRLGGNSPKFEWLNGDIAYAEVYAGILDGNQPSAVGREIGVFKVYPDGKIDLSDDLQNNTIAVGGYIQNFGGTIAFGHGQKVLLIP